MCICNLMALWWNILLGLFPVFAELKYVSLCFVVLIAFLVLLEHEGVSSWSRALCAWWRAAETRRENANTSHSCQLGLPKGPNLTRHADTMQWGDGIAGDTFAEALVRVTYCRRAVLVTLWGFSPSGAVGWWGEAACMHCTDTKSSCICSTCLLSPLQLISPPWRDRVQFSTLSQIIIISAIACDGSLPWGACSGCRRLCKMLQMMLCAILAVHFLHVRSRQTLVHSSIRKFLDIFAWGGAGTCTFPLPPGANCSPHLPRWNSLTI